MSKRRQDLSWRGTVCDRIRSRVGQLVDPWVEHVSQRAPVLGEDGVWRPEVRTSSTEQPSLLDQLEHPTRVTGGVVASRSGSRPPGSMEGVDLLRQIELEAREWVWLVLPSWSPSGARVALSGLAREVDDTRLAAGVQVVAARLAADSRQMLRRLAQVAPTLPDEDLSALDVSVRHWWARARMVTSWDSPAHRLHVRCPQCQAVGKLVARTDTVGRDGQGGAVLLAVTCLECHQVWQEAG